MFPQMRTGNLMQPGWYVKALGKCFLVISKIGDDGFKTTYWMSHAGVKQEIILNNKLKFEVQIKGMM